MFSSTIERLRPTTDAGRKFARYSGILAVIIVAWLIPNYVATGTDGPLPLFTVVLCAV